jgi:hypothetical protein
MRSPKKATTVAALAGAVALASAAYGIGTQAGDGTATARDGDRENGDARFGVVDRFDGDRFGGGLFGGLADELGVEADELRNAMEDFFEQKHGERRDAFATALAEALNKPVDEVRAALDQVRPGDRGRPGCGPFVSLRRLAAELDVTRAELRNALREVRADVDSDWDDLRSDLAAFLADRFGLSKAEVEEALPEPPRFDRDGPDGRPGFGPDGPPRFERDGVPG